MNCTRCSLYKTRRNIVVGRGNAKTARWVFLGEGPGKTEDLLGKAFIGQAGQLQDELIGESGGRVEDCYFTNIVWCHPTDQLAGENREPTADEVLMCSVNVCRLINEINPERVVLVGKLAQKYYAEEYGYKAVFIYHTGAMLRSGRKTSDYWKISLNRLKGVFNG